jgi:hypothetical protein
MRSWMIKCDTGLEKRFLTSNHKGTVINFQLGLVGQYGFIFLSWNHTRLFFLYSLLFYRAF